MACRINLPDGWGDAVLRKRHERRTGAAYSYDHLGHQLTWSPAQITAQSIACDVEQHGRDSAQIAAHFGMSQRQFLRAWVLTEVLAKLLDVPILSWLKRHGLAATSRGEVEQIDVRVVRRTRYSDDTGQRVRSNPANHGIWGPDIHGARRGPRAHL